MKTKKFLITTLMSALFLAFVACSQSAEKKEADDAQAQKTEQQAAEKQETAKKEMTQAVDSAKKAMDQQKVDKFAMMDADKSGDVSQEEFVAFASDKAFAMKDKNKDGKLQKDECKRFDDFNKNGDDFVSKEEFVEGHKAMFGKIDANGDGKITKDEFQGFMKKMMAGKKCGAGKCGAGKCGGGK